MARISSKIPFILLHTAWLSLYGLSFNTKVMNGHYVYVLSREGYLNLQGVSRLVDITAGGDFLGICDQKSSYKHVSDFGRLRSYERLKLRIEVNDY